MQDIDTFKKDAGDHIKNMNKSIDVPASDKACSSLHDDVARLNIWVIRRLEDLMIYVLSNKQDKGCRVIKFAGNEFPVERGFTFRDIMSFVVVAGIGFIIYMFLKKEGAVL